MPARMAPGLAAARSSRRCGAGGLAARSARLSASELRARAEEVALAESLIADATERIVVFDALLVEQVDDVREYREVLVHVPAHRRIERAVVLVELRQATAAGGRDQPLLTPVVRGAHAEMRILVVDGRVVAGLGKTRERQ